MKHKKATLALLTVLGLALSSWESRPMDEARCAQEGKTVQRCQKENEEDNEYDFTSYLTPESYKVYEDFSPEQKQMSMDYADGNRMDPNDAVMQVASQVGY